MAEQVLLYPKKETNETNSTDAAEEPEEPKSKFPEGGGRRL